MSVSKTSKNDDKFLLNKVKQMKKVLVTGATGSIGEEIVKEYAKNGFFVYIHYNSNHQKAQNLLEEIDNKGELISFDIKDKK